MSLLIDVIVIAAFAVCIIRGIRRGFVKSVIGIVVVIAAIFGSVQISPALATKLNDKFIRRSVVSVAMDAIPNVEVDTLVSEMPPAFLKALDRFGTESEEIKALFQDGEQEKNDDQKRQMIAEKMAAPLATTISKALAFMIVFAVLYLVLFILSLVIGVVFKLPVLKTADKFLGMLLGGATGLFLAWGISIAICALLPHLSVLYENVVPEAVIENSIVVKFLGAFDPFDLIK
jgi:uncharacterized membrane protein required for colicin V production